MDPVDVPMPASRLLDALGRRFVERSEAELVAANAVESIRDQGHDILEFSDEQVFNGPERELRVIYRPRRRT